MARVSSEERRRQILESSLPLFATQGLHGVTTKELAREAGVSEALLYKHFATKREIYGALCELCVERATFSLEPLGALPRNTKTLILSVYVLMRSIQLGPVLSSDKAHISRLFMRSLMSNGNFIREFLEKTAHAWIAQLHPCFNYALENGDLEQGVTCPELHVWLAHHLSVTICNYQLPQEPVINYGLDPYELLNVSVLFTLRGMGLKEKAIQTYFHPGEFELMAKGVEKT